MSFYFNPSPQPNEDHFNTFTIFVWTPRHSVFSIVENTRTRRNQMADRKKVLVGSYKRWDIKNGSWILIRLLLNRCRFQHISTNPYLDATEFTEMKSIGVITTRITINEKLLACKKIESFLKVLITDWIWYQIKNIIKDLWPSSNDIETYIDIKLTYINY